MRCLQPSSSTHHPVWPLPLWQVVHPPLDDVPKGGAREVLAAPEGVDEEEVEGEVGKGLGGVAVVTHDEIDVAVVHLNHHQSGSRGGEDEVLIIKLQIFQ